MEIDDPIDYFYQMGIVYRDFMLNLASLVDTVFGLEALENYEHEEKLIERVRGFEHFDEVIERLIEDDILPEDID